MLLLNVTDANGTCKQYDLSQVPLPLRIGRDNGDAYIKIADPYLSKHHCSIFKRGPQFYIADHGSRNGSIVNGTKVEEAAIGDGDRVSIGVSELHLIDDGKLADDAFVGREINGYVLDSKIGQGNQASVYLSLKNPLGHAVALKILEADKFDAKNVAVFDNESYQISKLDHPHIIKAHDFFEVDGLHVIVMALLQGDDAAFVLQKHKQFTVKEALRFLINMADAIGHLGDIGVIHRDVKPANVVINADGDYILTDFGLAKDVRGVRAPTPGRVAGTPLYMSPEQIVGKSIDHRADIYSLGVSVWHLITGQPIYSGDNVEVLKAHLGKPLPKLRKIVPDLNREISALLRHMLAKDPKDRPDNGHEIQARAESIYMSLSPEDESIVAVAAGEQHAPGSGTRRIVKARSRR